MDLLDTLLEKFSKSLLKRNKGIGVIPNTSIHLKNDIINTYIKTKQNYKIELNRNLRSLISGKIDRDTYLTKQRASINTSFSNSFLLGKMFTQSTESGLTDDERRSIVYQVTKEMTFMEKFADDVMNNTGHMNYSRRMQMYVDSLDPMFMFGRLAYLPEDIEIHWQLGMTDKHCIDCLSYAYNSPYTKKTLPTIPKAGDSACLGNCLCSLNFSGITDDLSFVLDRYKDNKGNYPSDVAVSNLKSIMADFYYHRGLAVMDKNAMVFANGLRKDFQDYIRLNKLNISAALPVSRYINDIKLFYNNINFSRVNNIVELEKGDVVSLFFMGIQSYVKITDITFDNIQVKDISGIIGEVNLTNAILFKLVG